MLKLDELLKKIEDSKNKEGQDTYAVFLDKNADLQIAKISISPVSVHIKTRNEAGQETGYTNIAVNTDCRFFADTIYCYDDFRKRGIAARLNELMDFTLRNYSGFVIRGSYDPKQLSTDREMNIYRSPEDLERSAHAYYKSAGYKIVSCKEFAKNPDKFPYLNYLLDFMGEKSAPGTEVIVVKQIKPRDNWPFVLVNGLLVREGVLEEKYFEDAFNITDIHQGHLLKNVVSRKKQIVPLIMELIEKI